MSHAPHPGSAAPATAVRVIDNSSGVRLRRPVPEDADGVFSVHGNALVYAYDPQETQTSIADAERFLEPILRHWADHGFGYWTVLVPRTWWPEGVASPLSVDRDRVNGGMGGIQWYTLASEAVLNVYYRLAPQIHSRGIAGSILRTVVAVAPRIATGVDLVVRTRPANIAARRVAERAGFHDLGLEPGTSDMQLLRLFRADAGAAGG